MTLVATWQIIKTTIIGMTLTLLSKGQGKHFGIGNQHCPTIPTYMFTLESFLFWTRE